MFSSLYLLLYNAIKNLIRHIVANNLFILVVTCMIISVHYVIVGYQIGKPVISSV